jgi:hypothetical protein
MIGSRQLLDSCLGPNCGRETSSLRILVDLDFRRPARISVNVEISGIFDDAWPFTF